MTDLEIGSLFSGVGGLDLACEFVFGARTVWHVEYEDAPSRILQARYPGVPNYGDVTAVDFTAVRPVHVLTGGFPCQDVSLVGRRAGMKAGTRSGLWSEFARAIDALRPRFVVIENVRGLLSAEATGVVEPDAWDLGDGDPRPTLRALGAVLGDLADLGYDAEWCGVPASAAGAPHGRFRIFVLAYPAPDSGRGRGGGREAEPEQGGRDDEALGSGPRGTGTRPAAPDAGHVGLRELEAAHDDDGRRASGDDSPRRGAATPDAGRGRLGELPVGASAKETGAGDRLESPSDRRARPPINWGPYRPAVERWERVLGRVAPAPSLPDGRGGAHRLSAEFVEWMMGLPAGYVTDVPGISRREQLRALGNGVVPQQAALALRYLLARVEAP